MTPLQALHQIAYMLSIKPLDFWPVAEQKKATKQSLAALKKQKKVLEKKDLADTHAYKTLLALEKSVSPTEIQEVEFTQLLTNLLDIYRTAQADEGFGESLEVMINVAGQAKQRTLEHHVALEQIHKKGRKMSEEEQAVSDLDVIQRIGIFYVLEYTLQVLYEFTYISDEDKQKLLAKGLKTQAGNLPAYLPLEDTFRKELCYQIYDEGLRHTLLESFYKFEKVFFDGEMKVVGSALKEFNLSLLKAFRVAGLENFQAAVYTSFGNNVPVEEVIQQVESLNI